MLVAATTALGQAPRKKDAQLRTSLLSTSTWPLRQPSLPVPNLPPPPPSTLISSHRRAGGSYCSSHLCYRGGGSGGRRQQQWRRSLPWRRRLNLSSVRRSSCPPPPPISLSATLCAMLDRPADMTAPIKCHHRRGEHWQAQAGSLRPCSCYLFAREGRTRGRPTRISMVAQQEQDHLSHRMQCLHVTCNPPMSITFPATTATAQRRRVVDIARESVGKVMTLMKILAEQ